MKEQQKENEKEEELTHEDESAFLKRMLNVYDDKSIIQERDEMIVNFENNKIEINRNAATLVLVCVNRMFEILIRNCESQFEVRSKNPRKIKSRIIKKIYSTCAKLYISDYLLYIAMKSPIDDIFYLNHESNSW